MRQPHHDIQDRACSSGGDLQIRKQPDLINFEADVKTTLQKESTENRSSNASAGDGTCSTKSDKATKRTPRKRPQEVVHEKSSAGNVKSDTAKKRMMNKQNQEISQAGSSTCSTESSDNNNKTVQNYQSQEQTCNGVPGENSTCSAETDKKNRQKRLGFGR